VVGIDNTSARMEEYTHTTDLLDGDVYGGLGEDYGQLVEEVIRPMMEGHYGEAEVVGQMGSSLGGLISFAIVDQYPDRYDMAISLSGTMGWGSIGANNPTMIELYAAAGHRSTALYLDSGGQGPCEDSDGDGIEDDSAESTDNYCENAQLRDVLADAGYIFEEDLWHWHEAGAEHNEMAWAERVWRPLELFAAQGR
jgi:predicted alpha/beta superfamily hydrolase